MSEFTLGATSQQHLVGVHPKLKAVVRAAISLTSQDFTVFEGVRSQAKALENVAKGVSKTLHSLHVMQPDGYAHAVDLVPWYHGKADWSWPLIYPIAHAMIRVAASQGVDDIMVWGGVWDQRLSKLKMLSEDGLKQAVADYCKRHPGPDFLDGPHFEIHI